MDDYKAAPGFHARLRLPLYYEIVATTVRQLRRTTTLREMAVQLNAKQLTSPTGKPWDRQKLASFIRNNNI